MNNFSVYCYTNKINGKKYIGITSRTLPERAGQAGSRYKQCTRFYNAIKKYGWDAFDSEVLLEGLSKTEACLKEQELIAFYRTRDNRFGYNICTGGEIFDGNKGRIFSQESRKHMAEAQRGKKQSERTKEKIRQKAYGNQRQPAVGVVNLTTGERFERVIQAAQKYSVDRSNISRACNGELGTCAGCVWVYEKDLIRMSNSDVVLYTQERSDRAAKQLSKLSAQAKINSQAKKKPLIDLDTGEIYLSGIDAANKIGTSTSSISNCVKGKTSSVKGHRLTYYTEN